ncbi:MAG: dimethyl sulfoxide reductase anchor subunit [Alphaproteobacteria bacterium]|nr:dimethyl sulfoxide reductase anchor subunit [Alphaproteobacteria bacterium]
MHPAYSVIFFTTATGAGYGLLTLLGILAAFGTLPVDRGFAVTSVGIAFVLIVGGLLSSTFHLGHPERAWRALTQWRSSWLSREGVLAILTFGPTGLFALGWVVFEDIGGIYAVAGVLGAIACMATVYTTSMIYASLRTVRAWNDPWVTPVYLVLSLATGALLASGLASLFGVALQLENIALVLLVLATFAKLSYWRSIDRRSSESTAESATGLGHLGKVRLLDPPHTGTNYLMSEMGYQIARKHAIKLRRVAFALGILIPFVLTLAAMFLAGLLPVIAAVLAVLSAAVGVLVERWLFFAEAKHVVTLYYGASEA